MKDEKCEELAFPVLFPKGRYGYTTERKIHLTQTKYFNARLLHHSGRFANNPEYLFFAQFIIEQKKVSDSINIALKKVRGRPVTASRTHKIQYANLTESYLSRSGIYIFATNPWYPTLMATIYV